MEKVKTEITIIYTYLKKNLSNCISVTPYPGPWKKNNNMHNISYRR